jgi:hypothetical protein
MKIYVYKLLFFQYGRENKGSKRIGRRQDFLNPKFSKAQPRQTAEFWVSAQLRFFAFCLENMRKSAEKPAPAFFSWPVLPEKCWS